MSVRELRYQLSQVPRKIRWFFYGVGRLPGKFRDGVQNFYWKVRLRYFLPVVWVQPNMRSGLVEFIEILRKSRSWKKEAVKQIAAETGVSGHLTDTEGALLLRYVLDGYLPYPTVEEAIAALPRGGTIMCGPGIQYLMKPIVFPPKSIQLIGGQFCTMGPAAMEMPSSGRISIIGCFFMGSPPSPRDWSPRGEIIEGDDSGSLIRVNL